MSDVPEVINNPAASRFEILTDQGAAPPDCPRNITHLPYPLPLADLHDWLTDTVSSRPQPESA